MNQKTKLIMSLIAIFALWILIIPGSASQVHLTLNVHEGSVSGPLLAGVHITGTDGAD